MNQETEVSGAATLDLAARDGFTLFTRRWEPVGDCVGGIGLIHGLGEHSGRYEALAGDLTQVGYRVLAIDQRGHGQTGGPRGHVADYSLLLDDVDALVTKMAMLCESLPLFLYGRSFGGNVVLNYALRCQPAIAGIVVTSPLLLPASRPSTWKLALARLLYRVWPSFHLDNGLDPNDLSRDPQSIESYRSDPLVHRRISARLGLQMLEAGRWALEHADRLTVPLLLMHGGADKMTSAAASRELASRAGEQTECRIWDGAYHELQSEPRWPQMLDCVIDWLNRRREER